ncbi:MAG: threonine--tRNA ligase [Candidatus Aceula meridiana]|nr:threonine--tRNA ligase [Candidatus Aceula meridiana]
MDKQSLEKLRHSCSHVMAQAVKELWPEVKVAIGPAIENGFYYDFERTQPFEPQELKKITKKMYQIIAKNLVFKNSMMSKEKALEFFKGQDESYKVELIEGLEDKEVSIYQIGDDGFIDLCKGPHVENAGEIKAFKLLSVAGAYWRGDEKRQMLQRIYGTCFPSEKELKEHLKMLEEAQKRDHRKLGPQLDLFNFYQEEVGAGLVLYHPAGAMLRKIIEDYLKDENVKRGYDLVGTPNILKGKLWETSGHADYYRENMYYFNVDQEEYAVKPMNCPGHILIYKSKMHSYRDMPVRFFELGTVYRQEKTGVLHGLLRVRGFTQDDGHIFCRQDQIQDEVMDVIDFTFDVMKDFGFNDYEIELSTRPEKFIGDAKEWDIATEALKKSLEKKKISYQIHEGEGAFYGPKIDIKLKDAIGRSWQCATIQCDFALPERFDMTYINEEGKEQRLIMIHRAILGSLERFMGTLIEHYAGAFPIWLAPTQAMIVPITTEHEAFAKQIKEDLQSQGFRVIIDTRNETLNKRIREGSLKKIPYLAILGDKEVASKSVAVRKRGEGDLGSLSVEQFIMQLKKEVAQKI